LTALSSSGLQFLGIGSIVDQELSVRLAVAAECKGPGVTIGICGRRPLAGPLTPHSRLVWTNEEVGGSGQVTTVTIEEGGGKTLLVMHDLYPSKEALDDAIASGNTGGMGETFEQLDELLVTLGGSVGRS
jgi:hypothetical protein